MISRSVFHFTLASYEAIWRPAARLLRHNRRLAAGYAQRTLQTHLPARAELWIQAASVGESYLAWELLKTLQPPYPIRVLLTTNTAQGRQILDQAVAAVSGNDRGLRARVGYFPFDRPSWMRRVVARLRPRLAVLLETELWPGQLHALKGFGSRVLIVNGRMSGASLRGYRLWPSLWKFLAPDHILAISGDDARRFAAVFPSSRVEVAPNIKFDRLRFDDDEGRGENPLNGLFAADAPVVVLGSIRQEEESQIQRLVLEVLARHPRAVICIFPRHEPRRPAWIDFLNRSGLSWTLRSKIDTAVPAGTIVLWDTFGELGHAYRHAQAAYVGGSLAPLGGQNFLEPLVSGIRPVIGPWWESFHWVGNEIVETGLVRVAGDWREAAEWLSRDLAAPPEPERIRHDAADYVRRRQGGTVISCRRINALLSGQAP